MQVQTVNGHDSKDCSPPGTHWLEKSASDIDAINVFLVPAAGYTPRESSKFVVTLMNSGVEVWNDWYFIQLVDEIAVVKTLHEAQIAVSPGVSEIFLINIVFSSNLERKVYGLALFIPGRMATLSNICVGIIYHPVSDTREWAEPEVPWGE
jgi:hypothetical protein